jgi:FkbM family methyltransferase
MVSRLKSALRWVVWLLLNRYRYKDSVFYTLYLRLFFASHFTSSRVQQEFFSALILKAGGGTVFDIGANGGDKTAIFVRCARRVVSVEPSPGAINVLRQRFEHNPKVVVVPKGVGETEGIDHLRVFGATDGLNTFSNGWAEAIESGEERDQRPIVETIETPMTTLDKLMDEFGVPCYIKIDVEGYELHVVSGLSQSVPLLSFECNLPHFKEESDRVVDILFALNPICTFNYCITEPPAGFEMQSWVGAGSIKAVIRSGEHSFMEIFCRANT